MQEIRMIFNEPTDCLNDVTLPEDFEGAYMFHRSMEEYQSTPLHKLKSLARDLKVKGIYVKDESHRFGLNAFKGIGVSYALNEIIKGNPSRSYTFVSCTDGNHGNALAWRANMLGHKSIIFMPKGSEERRVRAIQKHNARVDVTDMNYDDTVRYAQKYAKENNHPFVQDTALPGYTEIPNNIVLGYSTMVQEALEQMSVKPTHVFLQAGVGSMAGGVLWYLHNTYGDDLPMVGIIEASTVACIYESVKQGRMVSIGGEPYTAMAGLNCGEPSITTFPLIKAKSCAFITCRDEITFKGMNRAKNPAGDDPSFSSGESGAVGLGFVEEVITNPEYGDYRKELKIDEESVILLFNTEGVIKDE